jgi:hypothetical protein
MKNGVHMEWLTGGGFVPSGILDGYYEKGKTLMKKRSLERRT